MTNKTLLGILKKKLTNEWGAWAEKPPRILWAYRTTAKTPRGETPFALTYRSEVVVPVKVVMPSYRVHHFDKKRNKQGLEENLDLLEEMSEEAEVRMVTNMRKAEHYFNRRVKPRSFKLGDLVLK